MNEGATPTLGEPFRCLGCAGFFAITLIKRPLNFIPRKRPSSKAFHSMLLVGTLAYSESLFCGEPMAVRSETEVGCHTSAVITQTAPAISTCIRPASAVGQACVRALHRRSGDTPELWQACVGGAAPDVWQSPGCKLRIPRWPLTAGMLTGTATSPRQPSVPAACPRGDPRLIVRHMALAAIAQSPFDAILRHSCGKKAGC